MFCQNCGNKIDEGLRFCGKCGAPVNIDVYSSTPGTANEVPVSENPQTTEQPAANNGFSVTVPEGERVTYDNSFLNIPQEPPRKKKGKPIKILAVVLAVLIVIGSCGFLFRDYISILWYWTKSND